MSDVPALGELARLAKADAAELNSAAQEYEDSADACDTPALAGFRRRRYVRAKALRAAADRLLQLVALATGGGAQQAVELRCSGCTVTARVADGLEGFTHHCGGVFRRAIVARSLTPERPADATPAPVRRGRLSEHACDRCKQHEVYVSQDSDDDADYTIHCYGCGHHYRVDGPDA